jgi:hypothetical protein
MSYQPKTPGIYCDYIGSRTLTTSTLVPTTLSGDLSGNAADYKIPTACQGLLWIQPTLTIVTPTVSEATMATLSVDSSSIGLTPFEVLAAPLYAKIATTNPGGIGDQDQGLATYPLMFASDDSKAGLANAPLTFKGTPQVTNTAGPTMGAKLWWTDSAALVHQLRTAGGNPDRPFNALVGGSYEGGGAATSTGTATGAVTGKTATVSGGIVRRMRGLFGVTTPVTPVTVKPFTGFYIFTAPELPYVQRLGMEPLAGPLGTSTQVSKLTADYRVSFDFATPTTVLLNASFDAISSTAGNFAQGILFQ